jgi:hypothetical protein
MSMLTRRNVYRAIFFIILGLVVGMLLNQTVWSDPGDIRGSDVSVIETVASAGDDCNGVSRWFGDNVWNCPAEDLSSPDARQLYGNTATACGVGWLAGGPAGCAWGALGGVLSAIPWDGTWD